MRSQLVVAVVMEARGGGILDCAAHPLHLTAGPRMAGFGQPVLDAVCLADHVEAHQRATDGAPFPRLLCELDSVIGENATSSTC